MKAPVKDLLLNSHMCITYNMIPNYKPETSPVFNVMSMLDYNDRTGWCQSVSVTASV